MSSYYPPGPPTNPSMPFGAVPEPPADKSRRTMTIALIAVVGVLALVFASVVVMMARSDDGFSLPGLSLVSRDDPGEDPFTPSVALTNNPLENVQLANRTEASDQGVVLVNGTTPGLYASGPSGSCDAAALGNYLGSNPSAGRAWASVFGINQADIPYYLNTLTPVVLTADTWVTNHSYTDGSAWAFQSVLQSGTAVMVDSLGVPRVQCACGNPLAPPAAAPVGGYRLTGAPWSTYNVTRITRVNYTTQNVTVINNTTTVVNRPAPNLAEQIANAVLTILATDTGELVERPVGNIMSGVPDPVGDIPTPDAINTPYVAATEEAAAANGLARAGSPDPAPELAQRASENNGVPEGDPAAEEAPADVADDSTGAEGSSAASSTQSSASSSSAQSSAEAPDEPQPTRFTGSGDSIGSLTFTDEDDSSVTCTAPSEVATGPVTLSCSDSVPRTVSQSALSSSAVSSATDADEVWTVSLTENGSSTSVPVTNASWQTLVTPTTQAPPPTTQAPVETAPPTTVEPSPEPETTTVPTTVEPEPEEIPESGAP